MFNFEQLRARVQGLGGASSFVAFVPGALDLVAVVLAVVSAALVVAADVSWCALLDLVRMENLSRSLSAKLNLFLDPSAAEADEAGSVGCCCPDSLASCLRMAIRSWTGAWRVARIRWTREWWTTAPAGTAGVGSSTSVGEEGSPALKLLRTGRRSTRLENIRVTVKQLVGIYLPQGACSGDIQ